MMAYTKHLAPVDPSQSFPALSKSDLRHLSWQRRAQLAAHPGCPPELLRKLSYAGTTIARAAHDNPNCPPELREALAKRLKQGDTEE